MSRDHRSEFGCAILRLWETRGREDLQGHHHGFTGKWGGQLLGLEGVQERLGKLCNGVRGGSLAEKRMTKVWGVKAWRS